MISMIFSGVNAGFFLGLCLFERIDFMMSNRVFHCPACYIPASGQ